MFRPALSAGRRRAAAMLLCVAPALVLHHSRSAAQACPAPANPPAGPLCGDTVRVAVNSDTVTMRVFRGIPYAVPTTHDNNAGRWQPPVAHPRWSTPRRAVYFGQQCPQLFADTAAQRDTIGGNEDCLYLNVWQPPTASPSSPLPVMVFIHGGTFFAGSGSLGAYHGNHLAAAGNVVVVTLNYRLGALGWLTADTSGASIAPNLGLRDQQLALEWVQKNIGAFGGDSSRVTLFGESAGAMSTGLHLLSVPSSVPLFRAAIMESNLMAIPYHGTAEARADGNGFLGKLCRSACSDSALRALSTRDIMLADSAYRGGRALADRLKEYGMPELIPWSPVVDGSFVVAQPAAGYAAGMRPKPYVFGVNLNEGVLFGSLVEQAIHSVGFAVEYKTMLMYLYGAGNVETITAYRVSLQRPHHYYHPYTNGVLQDSSNHYLDRSATALANVLNDALFHCGNLASADSALAEQPDSLPIFGYLFLQPPVFNHAPLEIPACVPQAGYVCHTYELPYVFNNLAYAESQPGSIPPTPSDITLGQSMSAAWASFATNPTTPAPGWQRYTANGGLYMWGGSRTGTMLQNWSSTRNCTLWSGIPPRG